MAKLRRRTNYANKIYLCICIYLYRCVYFFKFRRSQRIIVYWRGYAVVSLDATCGVSETPFAIYSAPFLEILFRLRILYVSPSQKFCTIGISVLCDVTKIWKKSTILRGSNSVNLAENRFFVGLRFSLNLLEYEAKGFIHETFFFCLISRFSWGMSCVSHTATCAMNTPARKV